MHPSEPLLSQRKLVGQRLRLADREIFTRYVFPFADSSWIIPFVVVDVFGAGPRIHEGPMALKEGLLRSDRIWEDLRPVESIPVERFRELAHFDPWWAFRGIGGVGRPWIEAVIDSNLARPFKFEGTRYKVHDLTYSGDLGHLEAIVAKDELFHPRTFRRGEIDLLALRRAAKTL